MTKLLAAVALLCASSLCLAQTKPLVVKQRTPSGVSFEGFRSFALPTACDEQGRLYVKLVEEGPGMVGPIYRLSSKGALEAQFDTTGELMNRYAVRPNGGVVMVRMDAGKKFLDVFAPNGAHESSVPLEKPPIPFFPDQMAVFRSGEIFVAGKANRRGVAAAIYDPAGHFVKQVSLQEGDTSGDANSRSVAITGDDGLVYLMRASNPARIYAISQAGDVVRQVLVNAPTATGLPDFGLRVFKNRMAIAFRPTCELHDGRSDCQGAPLYVIVDATTGKTLAAYEPQEGAGGMLACYAPDPDRFWFFSILPENHRLDILESEEQ